MLQSAHITWHIYTYTHVHQTLSKQTYTHRLSSSNACAHTHTHKKTYTHRPSSSSKVRASKDGGNNPNAIGTLRESVQWGQDEEKDDMPKARGLVRVCVCRCVCVHECACMCAKVCACVHASVHFLCMRACCCSAHLCWCTWEQDVAALGSFAAAVPSSAVLVQECTKQGGAFA